MARTLFEMLKARAGPAAELKVYNPLRLRIGIALNIDSLDYRGTEFKVVGIHEVTRIIDSKVFRFVDYVLDGRDGSGAMSKVRLRLNPLAAPDPASGLTHSVLVLSLYYECGYQDGIDTGLADGVNADTGEFEIDWDGKRTYYRINDLRTPHEATVKSLEDTDGNGVVDADEIAESPLQFWDYHTELQDEASQTYLEYLFVEREQENGWWQIWRGVEVNPEQVALH